MFTKVYYSKIGPLQKRLKVGYGNKLLVPGHTVPGSTWFIKAIHASGSIELENLATGYRKTLCVGTTVPKFYQSMAYVYGLGA